MVNAIHNVGSTTLTTLAAVIICLGSAVPQVCRHDLQYSSYDKEREKTKVSKKQVVADKEDIIDRFKFASEGGYLLLPVQVKGIQYLLALDTGASSGCYDSIIRPILGKPLKSGKVWTPGRGDIIIPIYRAPPGRVGKMELPITSDCFCKNLGRMREVSGQDVYGCLGMDFLRKYVIRIDFDCGEVTFRRQIDTDPGQRFPISFHDDLPYVSLNVPGMPEQERFLVDTGLAGFTSGNLQAKLFSTLAKRGLMDVEGQESTETLSGTIIKRFGCLNAIKLGSFRHEKLLFMESNRNTLGIGYLSRYVVTFDFPNRVMYLKKGSCFDRPEIRDESGMDICRKNGLIVVESVAEESAAAKAGIRSQDELLEIDDNTVSEISIWEMRRRFSNKNKKYRLLIRRDKEKLRLVIDLRE